jgi:hypothetical protein
VFAAAIYFHHSSIFACKAEPTTVDPLMELYSKGRLLALPANIRLGRKGLAGTNILACFNIATITAVKGFIVQSPGPNVIKLFVDVIYEWSF